MAKKIKKDTIIKICALVLAVGVFVGAALALSKMISSKNANLTDTTTYTSPSKQRPTLLYNGKNYQMRDNMEVILVMGVDDYEVLEDNGSYINSSQADVIYIYAIDHANKTYQAIQLNRDTMTGVRQITGAGIDDIEQMQLCLSHSYGNTDQARCLNTVEAVSALLFDVPVDHYISLTMSAISVLNEQVGGVTVTVPAGLESADPAFVEGATVTLHGDQAEKFVRTRLALENDTNEFRMQRQQIFLNAWKAQADAKIKSNAGFAIDMVFSLSDYMTSDMSADQLSDFANQLSEYEDLGTLKTQGETFEEGPDRPFREYYVDSDDLQYKVIVLFYEEVSDNDN